MRSNSSTASLVILWHVDSLLVLFWLVFKLLSSIVLLWLYHTCRLALVQLTASNNTSNNNKAYFTHDTPSKSTSLKYVQKNEKYIECTRKNASQYSNLFPVNNP